MRGYAERKGYLTKLCYDPETSDFVAAKVEYPQPFGQPETESDQEQQSARPRRAAKAGVP